jgi:hypothetical protein
MFSCGLHGNVTYKYHWIGKKMDMK